MDSKPKVVRFTELEKSFLLLLIEKHHKVIENKETDGVSLQHKKKVWNEISAEYNREPDHTKRTVSQLQKCWDNVKTKRKKVLTLEKRERLATGGGPYQSKTNSEAGTLDMLLVNATDIEIEDAIDSDTAMLSGGAAAYQYNESSENTTLKDNAELSQEGGFEENLAEEPSTSKYEFTKMKTSTRASSTLKKKTMTARQSAINLELKERMNRLAKRDEEDAQFFSIKKEIALENLKEAKIKLETAKQVQAYEKELYEIKKRNLLNDS